MAANLKTALLGVLTPQMKQYGFSPKSAKEIYARQRGGIRDIFQLVCLDGKPGYRIQPNVAVRIEDVEDIFHQTSGFEKRYQNGTPTMGSSIGNFLAGDSRACEFRLETEAEIEGVANGIVKAFQDFALVYYERWGSLRAIDTELNDAPMERTRQRALAWFRCSTGIIVARLLGRNDYASLVKIYRGTMEKDNKGFYLKRFEALLAHLESVEPGSAKNELR